MWESIRLLTFGRVRGIAIMRSFRKELDMVNGARQPLVLAFKEFVLDKSHGLENGKKIITRVISARIKCDNIFSTTIFFYLNENWTSASHCCIHTNILFLIIFFGYCTVCTCTISNCSSVTRHAACKSSRCTAKVADSPGLPQ